MKTFTEFVNEDKQELEEIMGQFKDASKKAMELAKKLGKMITIMQHTSEGDYKFAENRNQIRKLERKDYEVVDTVAARKVTRSLLLKKPFR